MLMAAAAHSARDMQAEANESCWFGWFIKFNIVWHVLRGDRGVWVQDTGWG